MARDRKTSPLWQLVPARALVPPTGPAPLDIGFTRPSREVGQAELRPLRVDDDWRSLRILDALAPAADNSEALSRLLVAAAVTQGPGRLHELADKARGLIVQSHRRVETLVQGDGLPRPHRGWAEALLSAGKLALAELPEVRMRAANDMDPDVSRPYGLRLLDLMVLCDHVRACVGLTEAMRRPNPAGLGFARALFEHAPEPEFAETWVQRLMGSAPLRGVQLFWPREYDRLLLVFDDGRLAYDPRPPDEDEMQE